MEYSPPCDYSLPYLSEHTPFYRKTSRQYIKHISERYGSFNGSDLTHRLNRFPKRKKAKILGHANKYLYGSDP